MGNRKKGKREHSEEIEMKMEDMGRKKRAEEGERESGQNK